MSLREILWHNECFDPEDPTWTLEGTAYNEDDQIVEVVYRLPDMVRTNILKAGRIAGGIEAIPVEWTKVIQRDQPEPARRKFHTHGTATGRILGR